MQEKLVYLEGLTYRFHLNETEQIRFAVQDCKTNCLYYDSWVTVFFTNNKNSTLLAYGILYEKLGNLLYLLEKSLKHEDVCEEKQEFDIGLRFNEMHYKKSMLHEKVPLEELYKHVVWSPIMKKENIQTWLYSNTNGEIVLFLAPVYPFFFIPKQRSKYVSYDAWIKNYKPLVRTIISKDVAQQWLQQVQEVMHFIETNSATK